MNLLISPTSVKQSRLREKASVLESSHTSDSSRGDSCWGRGAFIVKLANFGQYQLKKSRETSEKKKKCPHCYSHAVWPRSCRFLCPPPDNLGFEMFWLSRLRSRQCLWAAQTSESTLPRRDQCWAKASGGCLHPTTAVPGNVLGIMALGHFVSVELWYVCIWCTPNCITWSREEDLHEQGRPMQSAQSEGAFWGLILLPLEHPSHPL